MGTIKHIKLLIILNLLSKFRFLDCKKNDTLIIKNSTSIVLSKIKIDNK